MSVMSDVDLRAAIRKALADVGCCLVHASDRPQTRERLKRVESELRAVHGEVGAPEVSGQRTEGGGTSVERVREQWEQTRRNV
jgi:CTP:molybdopterin cytidylyltransferase MocA